MGLQSWPGAREASKGGTKGSTCPFGQGQTWAPSWPRGTDAVGVEEKTWTPVPRPNQESLMLRADSCTSPRDSVPVKKWGVSMFLIKLESIKLCFPITN